MANDGIQIINRMIENDLNGRYDKENQLWYIPSLTIGDCLTQYHFNFLFMKFCIIRFFIFINRLNTYQLKIFVKLSHIRNCLIR